MKKKENVCCMYCSNYEYDEDAGAAYCSVALDEDDMERYMRSHFYSCPYYKSDNEYDIVKKQN